MLLADGFMGPAPHIPRSLNKLFTTQYSCVDTLAEWSTLTVWLVVFYIESVMREYDQTMQDSWIAKR